MKKKNVGKSGGCHNVISSRFHSSKSEHAFHLHTIFTNILFICMVIIKKSLLYMSFSTHNVYGIWSKSNWIYAFEMCQKIMAGCIHKESFHLSIPNVLNCKTLNLVKMINTFETTPIVRKWVSKWTNKQQKKLLKRECRNVLSKKFSPRICSIDGQSQFLPLSATAIKIIFHNFLHSCWPVSTYL